MFFNNFFILLKFLYDRSKSQLSPRYGKLKLQSLQKTALEYSKRKAIILINIYNQQSDRVLHFFAKLNHF
ncbi:hypothetical protein WALBB_680011 [Wolbachia pipientis wAlbB]|nr:hypothetical protein WALBB_680011 [Wolbachia pipientis wAlbB]